MLTRYALERLLYRLSISSHAERFVLKGAMLMMTWFEDPHRGTRDLDLLGFGDPDPDAMLAVFHEVLAIEAADARAQAFAADDRRRAMTAGGRCSPIEARSS